MSGAGSIIDVAALARLGPEPDVVISSRVRIARNVSGLPFVNRATHSQRHEVLRVVRKAVERSVQPGLSWLELHGAAPRDRTLLVERHLVSRHFAESDAPRALAVSPDERTSLMVNEEDHLRIQALQSGLALDACFASALAVDDSLAGAVDWAFHARWGYLTACPTNVGCGIRVSAMLHLPALRMTKEIQRVQNAAKDLHLAVRGYYGEGSVTDADFFQVSNQTTLGATEEALLAEFRDVVLPRLVAYERDARQQLLQRDRLMLEDRVHRALATLRSARLLAHDEAMRLLSRVRLGAALGLLPADMARVQRLMLEIQPAHLSLLRPDAAAGDDAERSVRADYVRQALS